MFDKLEIFGNLIYLWKLNSRSPVIKTQLIFFG